jgi:deazaflavin-dependent oxidoreductase (nitroreductase family)
MQMTTGRRIGNAVMQRLVSWNLVPRTVMLTTVGRKTGETRRTPVTLVHRSGRLYLVAPYGPVGWVWNARAAGTVRITGSVDGSKTDAEYAAREVPGIEAGPVLKDYWQTAATVRSYFDVPKGAPVEAFVREAHCHPVFELTPLEQVTPG